MKYVQLGRALSVSALVYTTTAMPALAQSTSSGFLSWWRDRFSSGDGSSSSGGTSPTYSQVPEIDASAGLLALAAVAAAMVLVWELRRRRSKG